MRSDSVLHDGHLEAQRRMQLLRPYYAWVYKAFQPHIGRRVVDAGAGIGNFTDLLSAAADYVLALDGSPANVETLRRRFLGADNVEVASLDLQGDLSLIGTRQCDTITCLDVIEHIQDDTAVLRSFYDSASPGTRLLLKVPACKFLYSTLDTASGHYRRYSRIELTRKCEDAGWKTAEVTYMNCFGILPYFIKGRILKKTSNFSRTFSRRQLKCLRRVIPVLAACDRVLGPPLGQSLLAVAVKDAERR